MLRRIRKFKLECLNDHQLARIERHIDWLLFCKAIHLHSSLIFDPRTIVLMLVILAMMPFRPTDILALIGGTISLIGGAISIVLLLQGG
jgi:hypothetical protein